jgi:hypothetical protein
VRSKDRARRNDGPLTFCALPSIVDDGEDRNTEGNDCKDDARDLYHGGNPTVPRGAVKKCRSWAILENQADY